MLIQDVTMIARAPGRGNREETGVQGGKDLCVVAERHSSYVGFRIPEREFYLHKSPWPSESPTEDVA